MPDVQPFEIKLTTLCGIESGGFRRFVESETTRRIDEKLPPLTDEERTELEIAFGCGCRHLQAELERRGAIRVLSSAPASAPAEEGTVPRG